MLALSLTKDIDTDVAGSRRDDVKRYIESRYGVDNVCSIGTYGTLKIKAAIRDLLRLKGIPPQEVNYFAAMISDGDTFTQLFYDQAQSPPLKKFLMENYEILNDIPLILNQPKNASVHAAGVVITPIKDGKDSIYNWLPVKKMDGVLISEWEGTELETAGFLKEDILGIKQLDKFMDIIDLIKLNGKHPPSFESIDYNDDNVLELFRKGWNQDVFHFGSVGLTSYSQDVKPESIEELIAMIALYRPGVMEFGAHEHYVQIKFGRRDPDYDWGCEEITKTTYSVLCVAENSKVTSNGRCVEIQNIKEGDSVLTEDGTYKRVQKFFNNGIKPTVRIRTSFGEELIVTEDHKVLTATGWKSAGSLSNRDIVKGFWMYRFKRAKIGDLKDWLIGLFLADGHSAAGVEISCGSKEWARFVCKIGRKVFPNMKNIKLFNRDNGKGSICWSVQFNQTKRRNGGFRANHIPNEFNLLLKEYGLFRKTKNNKFWPKQWTLSTIAGFIEGDGCSQSSKVTVANKKLAYGLFQSLQESRIYSSYFEQDGYYSVTFKDFDNKIPFQKKKFTTNRTYVPRKYFPSKLPSNHKLYRHTMKRLQKLSFISKDLVVEVGGKIEHDIWGRVLSVKKDIDRQVYDLTVDTNHSFVVGGLVVHNCYQEQAMKICQVVGGFTPAEADDVRKGIGKKIPEQLAAYRDKFVQGAAQKGCPQGEAIKIWNKIEAFGAYAFNRSHSCAYSMTGYFCQYLKYYYPMEFWTVSLQYANEEEIPHRINEIRKIGGITIMPPDINKSQTIFTSDFNTNTIYWSLGKIKFVGDGAVHSIIEERKTNGQYFSLEEFISRVSGRSVNKRVILNLILAGCFDSIYNISNIKERIKIVTMFFTLRSEVVPEEFITDSEFFWFSKQREVSGSGYFDYSKVISISEIPFAPQKYLTPDEILLSDNIDTHAVGVGVLVDCLRKKSKKGEFGQLVIDHNNQIMEVTLWNETWMKYKNIIENSIGRAIVVNGMVRDDRYKKHNIIHSTDDTIVEIF